MNKKCTWSCCLVTTDSTSVRQLLPVLFPELVATDNLVWQMLYVIFIGPCHFCALFNSSLILKKTQSTDSSRWKSRSVLVFYSSSTRLLQEGVLLLTCWLCLSTLCLKWLKHATLVCSCFDVGLHQLIFIVFSRNVAEKFSSQVMMLYLTASSNQCF